MPTLPLSLVIAAANPVLTNFEALKVSVTSGKLIGLIVAIQFLAILSYWLCSAFFAEEKATVGRALLTYAGAVGVAILAGLLVGFGGPFIAKSLSSWRIWLFGGGVCVLVLVLFVALPMKVYQIGLPRALGFTLLSGLIGFVFSYALQLAFLGGEVSLDTSVAREWITRDIPKPPVDRAARLEELLRREDELARRNQRLTIRYKHMPLDDTSAAADYIREKAAYERDLEKFRSDAAAIQEE